MSKIKTNTNFNNSEPNAGDTKGSKGLDYFFNKAPLTLNLFFFYRFFCLCSLFYNTRPQTGPYCTCLRGKRANLNQALHPLSPKTDPTLKQNLKATEKPFNVNKTLNHHYSSTNPWSENFTFPRTFTAG